MAFLEHAQQPIGAEGRDVQHGHHLLKIGGKLLPQPEAVLNAEDEDVDAVAGAAGVPLPLGGAPMGEMKIGAGLLRTRGGFLEVLSPSERPSGASGESSQ